MFGIMFWLGFFIGVVVFLVFMLMLSNFKPPTKQNDRHFSILDAQLKVFNERTLEERRLATALEALLTEQRARQMRDGRRNRKPSTTTPAELETLTPKE